MENGIHSYIYMYTQSDSTHVNLSTNQNLFFGWLSGEATCTLDGHWVPELQRLYDQEWCVSYTGKLLRILGILSNMASIWCCKLETSGFMHTSIYNLKHFTITLLPSHFFFITVTSLKWFLLNDLCTPQNARENRHRKPQKTTNLPFVTGGVIIVCCVTKKHNQKPLGQKWEQDLRQSEM